MSETTHTPGPWKAQLSFHRRTLCVMSEDAWICGEMQNERRPLPDDEAWANARLIAAAPTMAEALRAVVAALNGRVHSRDALAALSAARAALSLATGKEG